MKKNKTLLEKVRALLSSDIELTQYVVGDITYEAEALEVDKILYIVGTDSTEIAPAGEYVIEENTIVVGEEGKITTITPVVVETEMLNLAAVLEVNKWSIPTDGVAFNVGDVINVTWEDGTPSLLGSGEYELENGDRIQVDSAGIIVLKTPKGEETVPVVEASTELQLRSELTELTEQYNALQTSHTELTQTVAELSEVVTELVDVLSKSKTTIKPNEVELVETPKFNINKKETNKVLSTRDRVFKRLYGDNQ